MEITSFSLELLFLLFAVALVAGFIDTLAGGGGLLTIPTLLLAGLPPLHALGTNKLQAFVGTGTATVMLLRKRRITWRQIKWLMLFAFAGSAAGTVVIQFISTDTLSLVIPLVLLVIALYFLFYKPSNIRHTGKKIKSGIYAYLVVPMIGVYDGMFGPGTGSFFALSGTLCRHKDLIRATAIAKPLNFATNIASLLVFLLFGSVVWPLGLVMMVGQMLGASAASHFLYRINANYLRVLVVVMCTLMLAKYIYSTSGWF